MSIDRRPFRYFMFILGFFCMAATGDKDKRVQKSDNDTSSADPKQFEKAFPYDAKDRLGKLMNVMDKDQDGYVTKDELLQHLNYMQKRSIMKNVDRTWSHFEQGKFINGRLPWSEYRLAVYGMDGPELPKEYKEMMGRDHRRWTAADKDKDGLLTKEEYRCFMHPEMCNYMKDVILAESFEDIDKNKDGSIDMEEYIHDFYRPEKAEQLEPAWVKSERETFKTIRDKDGDGKLSKEEMTEWITHQAETDHAEEEANRLIRVADDNKDGKLSKNEMLRHQEVFEGHSIHFGDE